jgi:hypothetical protein
MRPTIENAFPLTDAHLDAVERLLNVPLPPPLRAVLREVNGGRPSPCLVRCDPPLFTGQAATPVYQFTRFDDAAAFAELCHTFHDGMGVPRSFLPLADADEDFFFADLAEPGWPVMHWQYVEGAYNDGDMDRLAPSLAAFLDRFLVNDA